MSFISTHMAFFLVEFLSFHSCVCVYVCKRALVFNFGLCFC
jgi:hypothetical protein